MKKTAENLSKNGMQVFLANTPEEAKMLVKRLIPIGASVACGGSQTLIECGVTEMLRNGDYVFFDRADAKTPEAADAVYAKEKGVDYFLSSSNAITEKGELYNVDGRANRVAAIAHGPKNVIIVAGKNKIVADLECAILRVKEIAAPKNCEKLGRDTYCKSVGKCKSFALNAETDMTQGCQSPERICCHYLVSGYQRIKNRIKVILVDDSLGF